MKEGWTNLDESIVHDCQPCGLTESPASMPRTEFVSAALGMDDLGGVGRQRQALTGVLRRDHLEDARQLGEGLVTSGHECVAAFDGWDLRDPAGRLIPVKNRLIVVEAHATTILAYAPLPFTRSMYFMVCMSSRMVSPVLMN